MYINILYTCYKLYINLFKLTISKALLYIIVPYNSSSNY